MTASASEQLEGFDPSAPIPVFAPSQRPDGGFGLGPGEPARATSGAPSPATR